MLVATLVIPLNTFSSIAGLVVVLVEIVTITGLVVSLVETVSIVFALSHPEWLAYPRRPGGPSGVHRSS